MIRVFIFSMVVCYSFFTACESIAERLSVADTLGATGASSVVVSSTPKQQIRLGIDAERLWYWRSNRKAQLAQFAVGELQVDYVRVAVNCAYEREEGVINAGAYDTILEMMNALKAVNPDIDFFASPRPLDEAYSAAEEDSIWNGKAPWSPYPAWIQEWSYNGNRWVKGDFHVDKLIQYYADYLNLMKVEGFDITYLDLSNEQTILQPHHAKYIKDNLPALLDAGVEMPELIAPSTWSIQLGINWLDAVDPANNEQQGFQVAGVHNTGGDGSLVAFADAAHSLGKEAWNTEMHGWMGVNMYDEVMSSSILWEHMRAGFNGIDTWLFFGPVVGKGHTMLWANWKIVKSGKYEIFKQVVNNANGGNYLDVTVPSNNAVTAAFIKDDVLSVWILNKDSTALETLPFELTDEDISGKTVNVTKWHGGLTYENGEQAGESTSFVATDPNGFTYDIDGESLYFFKIDFN